MKKETFYFYDSIGDFNIYAPDTSMNRFSISFYQDFIRILVLVENWRIVAVYKNGRNYLSNRFLEKYKKNQNIKQIIDKLRNN